MADWPSPKIPSWILPALPAAVLLYFWIFFVKQGLLDALPLWYWTLQLKPLPLAGLTALPGLAALGAVLWVRRHPERTVVTLVFLILLGACIQWAFAWAEGRGLDGIRDRMVKTGHAIFAKDAFGPQAGNGLTGRYGALIDKGELPEYPYSTKPPGHFLFYIATRHLARFTGSDTPDSMTRFASWFYPLLTYLPLIPLFFMGRRMLWPELRMAPLFFYLFVPSVTLVTLHLDQTLFPMAFMIPLACYIHGLLSRQTLPLLLSGGFGYLAFFVSFGMAALPVVLFLLTAFMAALNPETDPGRLWDGPFLRARVKRGASALILFAAGFAALHGLFTLWLHYDCFGAYREAMAMHKVWKIPDWTPARILYYGILDIFELGIWTGIPLSILFIASLLIPLRRVPGSPVPLSAVVSWSAGLLILLLAFAGRTASEVARLWIFLVPLMAFCAAPAFPRFFPRRPLMGLFWILLLQWLSILMVKRYFDFY